MDRSYYRRRPEVVAAVHHDGEVGPTLRHMATLHVLRHAHIVPDTRRAGWAFITGDTTADTQAVSPGSYIVADITGEITVLGRDEFHALYKAL